MPISKWSKSLLSAALLAAAVFSATGCTSDVQVFTNPKKARMQGIALYNQGDYGDAAGAFRNAIHQDPRDYKANYYLGVTYEALNSYQQAIQSYKASLDTMKATLDGQENLEFRQRVMNTLAALIARADDRNLEKDLLLKEARGQQQSEDYFLLAKIYRYIGDPDSALDAYNHAALLDPKDYFLLKEYGMYLIQIGQPQKAEAPLRKAYVINTHDPELTASLRQIGVVPGPSIKEEKDLVQPPLPKGPLPDVDLKVGQSQTPPPTPASIPQEPSQSNAR